MCVCVCVASDKGICLLIGPVLIHCISITFIIFELQISLGQDVVKLMFLTRESHIYAPAPLRISEDKLWRKCLCRQLTVHNPLDMISSLTVGCLVKVLVPRTKYTRT